MSAATISNAHSAMSGARRTAASTCRLPTSATDAQQLATLFLIPNGRLVAAGVVAVNRAQEYGDAVCKGAAIGTLYSRDRRPHAWSM